MATGYTCDVQNGKVTDLKDFVFGCARAFGALVMMRDEPMDAAIPDEFKPSLDYYTDGIERARKTLAELASITPTEIEQRIQLEYAEKVAAWRTRKYERDIEKQRYEVMLEKVRTWVPPSKEHNELHSFMVQQLTSSIEHDCNSSYDSYPLPVDRVTWIAEKTKSAWGDIEYYTKQINEEIARMNERNRWVRQLRESFK